MRFQLIRRLGLLSLGAIGALSCSDSSGPGTGKLTLLLKDNPGDIQAAWVTISEINLQGSGGTIHLKDDDFTVNLLALQSQLATLLQDAVIPAGTYTQLRFVISEACIKVEDTGGGSSFYASSASYATTWCESGDAAVGQLQMPSFSQSGLKVILPGNAITIPDGEDVTLIVDFDVQQSFGHVAGNSGQWVMHPVIKATGWTLTGSALVTLTLSDGVNLPTGVVYSATITPMFGGDPITLPLTDDDQNRVFQADFPFLVPGDYSVDITQTAGDPFSATITPPPPYTLTVPSGGTGIAAFTLTVPTST
jgi:hypothetical protein